MFGKISMFSYTLKSRFTCVGCQCSCSILVTIKRTPVVQNWSNSTVKKVRVLWPEPTIKHLSC